MKLIDANSLVILIIGLIDPKLVNTHSRTSIYDEHDFYKLKLFVEKYDTLVVLPNVWTELDNLLNKFSGKRKEHYVDVLKNMLEATSEEYLASIEAPKSSVFYDLGLTDSLLLEYSKECGCLITSDSKLSDYACGFGVEVFDLVKIKNDTIKMG